MKEKIEVIVICGPTASGKTAMAIDLAAKVRGEVVSVDSVQIYRHMDIGTAKPPRSVLDACRHHMINIIDPDQRYDAADYGDEAMSAIGDIAARGKTPLLVGGAGLYFKAILEGFFQGPKADPLLRSRLEAELTEQGPAALHAHLCRIDALSAKNIHINNVRRVIRAIEVFEKTGVPMSVLRKEKVSSRLIIREKIFLDPPRQQLYADINERTDRMFNDGLLRETAGLLTRYGQYAPGLGVLGYREAILCLTGEMREMEARDLVKKRTRNYAKRQLTWFRHQALASL
ncbi:MAG: tRNA (adenosine(37)-N6)-dimethylallyltransferase MiaA [Candidatus Raymondbacteria bacterium RifOxyA12_full_50_37]|uniref:tRNA dimethylallyltransferase n=1 Tax=Candidatus Raymondbacteria bacterium RIFOXYD12_FULL_49_13 TaxID=1817890 RepID=A0A1F7FAF6_UNCRA|nr:MAG: tRNA (adenosine(37)-N6)-dimethylallyltransferase MiaA [Candidatus Raymondbacteria bacterium RifOxyA12_full_50_37]OGJ91549.1 MAG: tRNA (adenosine(37)-N6)-dimethylallyltransferase MiaA [Candidatus Raymondbacteria bacterium RifOxyB12_full_50_8]OGJ92369.1 MAG: tRNA (adenosine(37)-N6)-dimethylallyltransferase MiaA [Candidatus Raymondbacteria bacterium RIFOXYA2_FULL_49_16]OGJ99350.1 MAG: tRNA (adenosine(37)-N6)-dimethylallyltransferase MiaA [Candidatus Raymondbacteria bacterium RIFOXYC2_FULL_5